MKIRIQPRPYILTFPASGASFPLTSTEALRLLDTEPYAELRTNPERVVFPAYAGMDGAVLQPATAGGGPAFIEAPAR